MNWDLVILIILIALVIFFFKDFSAFVYGIATIDIFLRILDFVRLNINVPEISKLIAEYLPRSIPHVIAKYTSDVLYDVVMWGYVLVFTVFLFYTARILWKKK